MKKLLLITIAAFILLSLFSCKPDDSGTKSISTISTTKITTVTFAIIPSGEEDWSSPIEMPANDAD